MWSKNSLVLMVTTIIILVFSIGYLLVTSVTLKEPKITLTVSTSTAPFPKKSIPRAASTTPTIIPEIAKADKETLFVTVSDSCSAHYEGECVRVRSGPGTEFPVVTQLRNGMVLRTSGVVEADGREWYKIIFDEWLRYPERLKGEWYVAAAYLTPVSDSAKVIPLDVVASTTKKIIIDRSDQTLTAYAGTTTFMSTNISTGLELTPTPRGEFTIFKKMPSRYMQGPLPYLNSKQVYDLPGVPWNLYFTEGGAVIHGAYWHTSFGKAYSHGCVNMTPAEAQKLYHWAEVGTKVLVRD